jgi:tetraacyldisaccharide 4'-kinase
VRRLRAALRPLALPYRVAVTTRNAAYARGLARVHDLGVPVVSIGNLTTGGTGKSPLVRVIVRGLSELGARPAVLLRGYGARGALAPVPTWLEAPPEGAVERYGDEALEHTRDLGAEVVVVAHKDRVRAGAVAVAAGADVLVLDDGFQHRRVRRDLDIVCLDARCPWGRGGGLLPAGDLREPASALARADLVMWTRARAGGAPSAFPPLPRHLGQVTWEHAAGRCRRAGGEEPATPRRVVVSAHVADPEGVAATAREAGLEVAATRGARDHAPFDESLIESLESTRRQLDADSLVITAKDEPRFLAVRAGRRLAADGLVAVLELVVRPLTSGEPLRRALHALSAPTNDGARLPARETGAS